ncbi:HAD family hydrolase [Maribacter sp. 2304DJ31-5]|uniref:HAD family hydrolase n=1 Tax=Maribacter sp. 2304DJ31-5 TaxID=3386273 RepID=UPI0039BCCA85
MNLSNIKMVVSDMDGTLLNSNHEVSSSFFELFETMKNKGIRFVAASGRQYNSIIEKLSPIKEDIIVVAENGGFVVQNDVELLSTPLSQGVKNTVLDLLNDFPEIHPVLCGKHEAYSSGQSANFIERLKEYYSEFQVLDDLKSCDMEIVKIALFHFESSEQYIYPLVKHLEENLKIKISGENWVDISSPNAHKGFALEKLMKTYNLDSNEVMVFGDYNNDLEMMALSDYSFAMENAHPNVKKVANFTTLSNDSMGVETILSQLLR